MPESSPFRTLFPSRRVAGCKTLLKSPRQHFYSKSSLMWDTLSWRTSLLVRSEVLGLFDNTLTADHIYSCHYLKEISATCSNAIISQRLKHSINFLMSFRNFQKIFCIFKKNITFLAQIFRKLLTPKNLVTLMPQSSPFRTPFGSQRVHGSKTLTNSAWLHF